MAAYRRFYDLCHLQGDCQEPESAPEPYARSSSMGYLFTFLLGIGFIYPFVIDVVKRLFNSVRPISCVVETEISSWCRFAETPLCIPCYYRMEPINSCNPSNLAVSQQCCRYESGSPRWRRNDMLACCGLSMVQSPGECF